MLDEDEAAVGVGHGQTVLHLSHWLLEKIRLEGFLEVKIKSFETSFALFTIRVLFQTVMYVLRRPA